VLSWLTRLFKQRVEAESEPPPAPSASPLATAEPPAATKRETEVAVLELTPEPAATGVPDVRETCPNCGRTSAFAGPPGQRFCMHCALREELFDQNAV
jgi:hypothetical protein